jgi:hypothetical protein
MAHLAKITAAKITAALITEAFEFSVLTLTVPARIFHETASRERREYQNPWCF